jgi:hypothetical protein
MRAEMEAVPLMAYLARRDRDYDEDSRHPKPVDVQAATEAWYEKGLADGRQKAKDDCDAAIRQHEEESKAKLDRARKIWAETESAALAQQTASAIAALKAEMEDCVARILRPLLEKRLIDEALTKLAIEMGKLLSDDDAIRFKISGPPDLVSQLSDRIPGLAPVTVCPGDRPEVSVLANKTVIETRLSEWLTRIGVDGHAEEEG